MPLYKKNLWIYLFTYLPVVYLMTLLVAQAIYQRMTGRLMNKL
jgi:hypothetical protein